MTDFTPTVTLPSVATTLLSALARKALTGVAGALVAWGVLPGDQTGQFVTVGAGLVLGAASVAWTWWEQRQARARLALAVMQPAAVPINHAGEVVAVPVK